MITGQLIDLTRHHAGDVVAASQGRVEQDPNRRALKQATGSETNGWGVADMMRGGQRIGSTDAGRARTV